jgi:NAD(P)-dependent dehydrogenase (short-subunit alcohol dehydrogenase family)
MVVVITGSTRGIGRALARAFLERGCSVVISGRSEVAAAVAEMASERVAGHACDVTDAAQVQALWDAAVRAFGRVDCWINNAGTANRVRPTTELDPGELARVVEINLVGAMYGSRIALAAMLRQGHGKLFNMEGWGSRGEYSPGMVPYATSKRALRYFTDALARENEGAPVQIGTLSPGMVLTELLESSYVEGDARNWLRMKGLFRFVVDPADVVCRWLAAKVLANRRSGAHYAWMTWWRLLPRFFSPYYWRRNPFAGSSLDRLGVEKPSG